MMDRCWGRGVCALVTEALAMEGEGVVREDSLDEFEELSLETDLSACPEAAQLVHLRNYQKSEWA